MKTNVIPEHFIDDSIISVFYNSGGSETSVTFEHVNFDYMEIPPPPGKGVSPTMELFVTGPVKGSRVGITAIRWSVVTRMVFERR
jgi:hypothetical protein